MDKNVLTRVQREKGKESTLEAWKQKFSLKNEKEIPGKKNSCAKKIKNTREIHVLERLWRNDEINKCAQDQKCLRGNKTKKQNWKVNQQEVLKQRKEYQKLGLGGQSVLHHIL